VIRAFIFRGGGTQIPYTLMLTSSHSQPSALPPPTTPAAPGRHKEETLQLEHLGLQTARTSALPHHWQQRRRMEGLHVRARLTGHGAKELVDGRVVVRRQAGGRGCRCSCSMLCYWRVVEQRETAASRGAVKGAQRQCGHVLHRNRGTGQQRSRIWQGWNKQRDVPKSDGDCACCC